VKKRPPRFHYAWLILIGCCFVQAGGLGAVLDACGVFFVPVCNDLGFTKAEISSYLTAYFIATIIAMPLVGNLLPKVNLRVVLSAATVLTALGVALMSTYTQSWQWWISGLMFGCFGSFIFVIPVPLIINNWFSERVGIAMGIAMSFSGIGAAVLGPVFTLIIQAIGWRGAYLAAAAIIVCLILPWTLFVLRFRPEDKGLKPYGYKETESAAAPSDAPVALPGMSARKALKTPVFWVLFILAGSIAYFAGFNSHLPGFAQSIGYDALFGSSLLSAVMIGSVADKLIMGYLNDRVGVQFTFIIQFILIALSMIIFICFQQAWMLYVGAVFFGIQNSLFSVSTPLLVKQVFGKRNFSQIFSYVRMGSGLFGMFGPMTIGLCFDLSGSFTPAFMIGAGICVLGLLLLPVIYRLRKNLIWDEPLSIKQGDA
jgi:MFS family permease